jgi:thiamine transport system permease protein
MARPMAIDREPSRRIGFPPGGDLLAVGPILLFVLIVTIVPVVLLIGSGTADAGGVSGVARVLADPVNLRAVENSLTEGAASAGAAVAIGYPVGVFLGRTEIPGRRFVLASLLVPFLLPTVAVAVGVVEVFGPDGIASRAIPALAALGGGFGGVVVANVLFNAPVVVLLTSVGAESASRDLEETVASLGGGPGEAYRSVWAGPSWAGALAGGLLTFLFSALAFAGPLLIGGAPWYTLEARVYTLAQTLAEAAPAAVLAGFGILLLAPVTVLYVALASRLRAGARFRSPLRPFDPRRPAAWVLAAITAAFVGGVFAFLASILAHGFTPLSPGGPAAGAFSELFGSRVTAVLGISTGGAIANTLLFATLASLTALLLALGAARFLARRPRAHRIVGGLAFAPLLVSPVVLAFALAEFARPALGGASAAPLLIVLSQATLALPFALQAIGASLGSTDPRPGEAARALGAGPWQAYLDVELPMARAGIRTAGLFAFALGLGEFTATNFLSTGSSTTLSVELYRLESLRLGNLEPAVAALLVLASLGVLASVAVWGEGRADVL